LPSGLSYQNDLMREPWARLILPGSDLNLMVRAATETAEAMRTAL
jgi:hypothetical protein